MITGIPRVYYFYRIKLTNYIWFQLEYLNPIIIYVLESTPEDRCKVWVDFRVGLYKKLLKAGYSILAFDYRGFADSTEITDITETTVVHDSRIALNYVR